MLRPESWTRPAGVSPVRVVAGEPEVHLAEAERFADCLGEFRGAMEGTVLIGTHHTVIGLGLGTLLGLLLRDHRFSFPPRRQLRTDRVTPHRVQSALLGFDVSLLI